MKAETFDNEMRRLITRFGSKAFDQEFISLVWRECAGMTDAVFQRAVDVWIGSRSPSKPPLLAEFREARTADDKAKLQANVMGALNAFQHPAQGDGLRRFLAREYPGAKTLWEAVEIQLHRNAIERANEGQP